MIGKNEDRFHGDPRFISEKEEKCLKKLGIADENVY